MDLVKDLSATEDVSAHGVARFRVRRGLLFGLVAVLVLGAALALTLLVQNRPPPGWTNIEERKLGISAEYPNAWHHQRFDHRLGLLAIRRGIVLSNVRQHFRYPDLGPDRHTSAWNMRALLSDAVVMEISQTLRFLMTCRETQRFPLSLDNAERARGAYGSPPRLFLSGCIEGKPGFGIHVGSGLTPLRKIGSSLGKSFPLSTHRRVVDKGCSATTDHHSARGKLNQ